VGRQQQIIILIEFEQKLRETWSRLLEEFGLKVINVNSPENTLNLLVQRQMADAILVGPSLGNRNGAMIVRKLHKEHLRNTPTIVVQPLPYDPDWMTFCSQTPAIRIISEPFDHQMIVPFCAAALTSQNHSLYSDLMLNSLGLATNQIMSHYLPTTLSIKRVVKEKHARFGSVGAWIYVANRNSIGTICVSLNTESAMSTISNMIGEMDPKEIDEELISSIAMELANQIGGQFRQKLDEQNQSMSMSLPKFIPTVEKNFLHPNNAAVIQYEVRAPSRKFLGLLPSQKLLCTVEFSIERYR
jgi:CheY-specific phosphatase CheX/CheY-like chemotaxis protein